MTEQRLNEIEALWNPSGAHVEELIAAVRARDARIAELEKALEFIEQLSHQMDAEMSIRAAANRVLAKKEQGT